MILFILIKLFNINKTINYLLNCHEFDLHYLLYKYSLYKIKNFIYNLNI
jgi:hypothetical protein